SPAYTRRSSSAPRGLPSTEPDQGRSTPKRNNGMLRFLGFYKRKPGLTHEQFNHHWMTIHGPVVRNVPGGSQYLKKYIQHHLTPDPLSGTQDFVYDGFSEGWFE